MPIEVEIPDVGRERARLLWQSVQDSARAQAQAERELEAYLEGILAASGVDPRRLIGLANDMTISAEEGTEDS